MTSFASFFLSASDVAIEAKYRRRFGVGGVVKSTNLVNIVLNVQAGNLSCNVQTFFVPEKYVAIWMKKS